MLLYLECLYYTKIFNYKHALQNIGIYNFKSKPNGNTNACSSFIYNPVGHVINCDLIIITNISLRDELAKGQTYSQPNSINYKISLKCLWILSRIMQVNRQKVKK